MSSSFLRITAVTLVLLAAAGCGKGDGKGPAPAEGARGESKLPAAEGGEGKGAGDAYDHFRADDCIDPRLDSLGIAESEALGGFLLALYMMPRSDEAKAVRERAAKNEWTCQGMRNQLGESGEEPWRP